MSNPSSSENEKPEIGGLIDDPDMYAQMISPHESAEKAEEAWKDFWADVYAARVKHRISDVAIVGLLRWRDEQDNSMASMVLGNAGDAMNIVRLLAFGYGATKKQFATDLANLANPSDPK